MKIWLIRHAIAVDRDTFMGGDLERPLAEKGIRKSGASFTKLAKLYKAPDFVYSSEAVRAYETAQLFCEAFDISDYAKTARLNPGCSFNDIKRIVKSVPHQAELIALFGHEPDFSNAISEWVSDGLLNIKLKKGGLVELEVNKNGSVLFNMSLPPKVMSGL